MRALRAARPAAREPVMGPRYGMNRAPRPGRIRGDVAEHSRAAGAGQSARRRGAARVRAARGAVVSVRGQAERKRLEQERRRKRNWKRWGPYLSERQWGTVREDYSADGSAWDHFPHDHARSRAYRWGEDGIAGISDEKQRLCFGLALLSKENAITILALPPLVDALYGRSAPGGVRRIWRERASAYGAYLTVAIA